MTPSVLALTGLIGLAAAVAIESERRGARRVHYAAKPLATLLLLALALVVPGDDGVYRAWVAAGLVFSLAGDVFLMLPRDRFVAGLASFLVAHLCYVAAFAPWPPRLRAWGLLVLLAMYGVWLMRALWPGLRGMRVPVAIYAMALWMMAWQAGERWMVSGTTPGMLAALGAVLFVVSDSVLAWERFVQAPRYGPAVVLATYFAAQWLISMSVAARPFG